jgi:hypothetical protein
MKIPSEKNDAFGLAGCPSHNFIRSLMFCPAILLLQGMILNNFDFTFEGSPDDVGMQTGATIHTMNGLKMYPKKVTKDDKVPATSGWWEKQHLKRGLSATGMPFKSTEEVDMMQSARLHASAESP